MNAQRHVKTNNKTKLPNHKKETNLYLPLQLSATSPLPYSAPCNTSFRRKPGQHPDYFQPHVPQKEYTNISCIIISSRSCLQTITSDKCKTL